MHPNRPPRSAATRSGSYPDSIKSRAAGALVSSSLELRPVSHRRSAAGHPRGLRNPTFTGSSVVAEAAVAGTASLRATPSAALTYSRTRFSRPCSTLAVLLSCGSAVPTVVMRICQEIPGALRLSQPASPPDRGHVHSQGRGRGRGSPPRTFSRPVGAVAPRLQAALEVPQVRGRLDDGGRENQTRSRCGPRAGPLIGVRGAFRLSRTVASSTSIERAVGEGKGDIRLDFLQAAAVQSSGLPRSSRRWTRAASETSGARFGSTQHFAATHTLRIRRRRAISS